MRILPFKHCLIFLFSTFLFIHTTTAQNLTGKVTDAKKEAIPGATVYIKEVSQGLLCNEDGLFQTTLKQGGYSLEVRCMGYKTTTKSLIVPPTGVATVDIVLEEQLFELAEVEVSAQEDPAYGIMRKAIEKAPYYAKAVESYSAQSYIKGNAILTGLSKFMEEYAKTGEGMKLKDLKNQIFVQESYSDIAFIAPDKYEQKVNAFSSSFPDNLDAKDVMGLMRGSVYNPTLGALISPLNEKSFSYYRFRYEGYTEEEGVVINKIQVIPKIKGIKQFSGYLYIADDTWHVAFAELSGDIYGFKPTYRITYQDLGGAYLPVTYLVNFKVDVFGIHGIFDYYASLKYNDVQIKADPLKEEKPLIEKKRDFEIKRYNEKYKIESDSLAKNRDSLYWEQIRIVPLEIDEVASLSRKDSIQQRVDSLRKKDKDRKFKWSDILSGGQVGPDSARVTFKYDGLFSAFPEYNFVDGLWIGQKFDMRIKRDSVNHIQIKPYIYYANSRERLMGGGKITFDYAPFRLGRLDIEGGSVSEDFNPDGIPRFNNALRSLIRGKNENFFYQKDFVSLTNTIDLANGLTLRAELDMAKRSGLENNTRYTWGRKRNIKDNPFAGERFDRTSYMVSLTYAPYAYYKKEKGKKSYVKITSPVFHVGYSEGIGGWQKNNSRFRRLEGGVKQDMNIGFFTKFDYRISGGGFLGNTDNMHFTDFNHFNTADLVFAFKSPSQSYMLLDNYEASTNDWWVRTAFNYNDHYLLLKRLPFLQGKMFTETLHLKNLYTPDFGFYTEMGYSVDFVGSMNLGIFTSFKKGHYERIGIRYSISLNRSK